ncbi:GatB/YqeY domain-containing protein [Flavobacteriales bacterium]|nr:GatB/YqeY domain-containing protein [Flavobacteriales bacterium]
MNLPDLISSDIKKAMLAKATDKLAALRAVKAAIMLEATKDGSSSISDEIALSIIKRLVKQRRDSAEIYLKESRQDLADDELKQLKHLETYLPEQLSSSEVEIIVKEIIVEIGARSMSDMGRVMGKVMSKLNGKADGKLISETVKNLLSK